MVRQPGDGAPYVCGTVATHQTRRLVTRLVGRISRSDWPLRLWDFDRHYRYIGGQGAGGLGYGAPAAAGAALAKPASRPPFDQYSEWPRPHVRTRDSFYPGPAQDPVADRHGNNRSYQAEVAGLRLQASLMNRDLDRAQTCKALDDPPIDFAGLARSMGLHAEGPISDLAQLRAALLRGLERVKAGEPETIDVLTQPR